MKWSLPGPVRSLIAAIARIVYPPLCYSCGSLLPESCCIVCPACVGRIHVIDRGDPLFALAYERLCGDGEVDGYFTLYLFEKGKELQSLLHQLKYAGAAGVGVWLGEQLGNALHGAYCDADLIVPVPLHTARRRERGYNQSELIAQGVRKVTGIPIDATLVRRVRHTPTQTALGVEERRRNMAGVFAVPGGVVTKVAGRRLLIVDDVITTGATIRSCAKALRVAGAQKIVACSVALADRYS